MKLTKTILPRMSPVGKRRLRKLIAFLRTLKPKQFDFGDVVADAKTNGHVCGTVCCAVGWTPAVFPRLVKWIKDPECFSGYGLDFDGVQDFPEVAEKLFGIPEGITSDLFHPGLQRVVHPSLPMCEMSATPKQVARMLEQYIKLTETPV